MKKFVIIFVIVLVLGVSAGLVYAANNNDADEINASCEMNGCGVTEHHTHEVCQVTGCEDTQTHSHDGVIYYGHSTDDGHAYHNCDTVECTEVNEHSHTNTNSQHGNEHNSGHH